MTRQIPDVNPKRVTRVHLRKMIVELRWDARLSYDYSAKRTLFDGEDMHYAELADKLRTEYENAEFSNAALADVLTGVAQSRTPRDAGEDVLLELVSEYISGKDEVSVREIIEAYEDKKGFDVINKSLEMRISACLKKLGYSKQRRRVNTVRYVLWTKQSTCPHPTAPLRKTVDSQNQGPESFSDTLSTRPHLLYDMEKEVTADDLLDLVTAALQ